MGALALAAALAAAASPAHANPAAANPAAPSTAALAAAHAAGEKIFTERCASCHDNPATKAPSRAEIGGLSIEDIAKVLILGPMAPQAHGLSQQEIGMVAMYVSHKAVRPDPDASANLCKSPPPKLNFTTPAWNGWGVDPGNARFQPQPGLAAADIAKLHLKWAFSYTGTEVYGQPTLIAGRVYVTSLTGRISALDAATGCTYWTAEAGAPSRTAISVGPGRNGHAIAYLGDEQANIHALDADTGARLWTVKVDAHPSARVTGAPALFEGHLYVPVASSEEAGATPPYQCCTFRGSVVALDAQTGKQVWKSYTVQQAPKPYAKAPDGTQLMGPAGASVWSAPTIDAKLHRLYVGTGNSYAGAPNPASDAIIAYDLKSGHQLWVTQVKAEDNFVIGCYVQKPPVCSFGVCNGPGEGECPKKVGPDYDFGASPILRTLPNGKRVLLAGAKSAIVYALDPDHGGKILWQQKVGVGGAAGGIEWGMAADTAALYAPTSDIYVAPADKAGGLTALDLATGKTLWHADPHAVCAWGAQNCQGAQSQAVSAIPGAVFSGALDGHLRAYAATDGHVLWDFDAGRSFPTVNQGTQQGGSLNLGGPTVLGGMVFVNAGYGRFAGVDGHVLLAFAAQ